MQTDPNAFAQSVIDILSSEDMRKSIGHAGMNVIKTRFDWDIIAKTLEDCFADISHTPNT
jgi:glycosyltransferase involved in cell wall biosynthesis